MSTLLQTPGRPMTASSARSLRNLHGSYQRMLLWSTTVTTRPWMVLNFLHSPRFWNQRVELMIQLLWQTCLQISSLGAYLSKTSQPYSLEHRRIWEVLVSLWLSSRKISCHLRLQLLLHLCCGTWFCHLVHFAFILDFW